MVRGRGVRRERRQPGELRLRHHAAVVQAHGRVGPVEFVGGAGVFAAFEDDACVLHAASACWHD
jgi:hypothetical protein